MLSLSFNNIYISDWYTVAGPDEKKSNIRNANEYFNDYYFGEETFEKAEAKMQDKVISNLIKENKKDVIIGGDLSNQLGILNETMSKYDISYLGVYSACASFIEGVIIGSLLIEHNSDIEPLIITSSHSKVAERQFRYPNEYSNILSLYQTCTINACCGINLTSSKTKYQIIGSTIGCSTDYDIVDVKNMGAVMAPACAHTIYNHLKNYNRSIDEYDLILTGDLGLLGVKILNDLLESMYKIKSDKIVDAGSVIYKENQNKCCGGSGPSVIPYVLLNNVLKNKKYKRILVVGTGSLHNTTLVNQGNSIPAIAHAIEVVVND